LVSSLEEHGLWQDTSNYVAFVTPAGSGPGATWHAWSERNNVITDVDTVIAVAEGIQKFRIESRGAAGTDFYIDDALAATINTNVPADKDLEPRFYMITGVDQENHFFLKYVNITTLRIVS